MQPMTKKVAKYYGGWVLLWVAIAFLGNTLAGHGEYGISAHLVLSFTGIPLALLSWLLLPNGTPLGTLVAGIIGLLQWCAVAELNALFNMRRRSSNNVT
jgi:hypothetical protein